MNENEFKTMKTSVILGDLNNLVTDMITKGATNDELRKVTVCSTLILEANKFGWDFNVILDEYNIKDLKKKYQVNK